MMELPRNIENFVVRDIIYIVGGASVICSLLYFFDWFPLEDMPFAIYLLGAGFSYVVGSTLQDLFSVLRIVTTAIYPRPNGFIKMIYKRFYNEPWQILNDANLRDSEEIYEKLQKDHIENTRCERHVSGLILAATMGTCVLVSGVLLFTKWCLYENFIHGDLRELILAFMLFFLAIGLIILNWMRAARYTHYLAERIDSQNNSNKVGAERP